MSRLLVITYTFPFSRDFIEEEVPHLARAFEEVEIVPFFAGNKPVVRLPPNVQIDVSLSKRIAGPGIKICKGNFRKHAVLFRVLLAMRKRWPVHPSDVMNRQISILWCRFFFARLADSYIVYLWARHHPAPDLVYTYGLSPAAISFRRAWPKTPIVTRAHGADIIAEQNNLNSLPLLAESIAAYDRIYCASQASSDYMNERFPQGSEKYQVSYLGIDDLGLSPFPRLSGDLRILSVSRIDKNKSVDSVLGVVAELATRGLRIKWTHVGGGAELPALKRRSKELPACAEVTFRGQLSKDEVKKLYAHEQFNVFLHLSRSEGGAPLAIMEAQCAGIPCVVRNAGGAIEALGGYGNCIVAYEATTEEIANSVVIAAGARCRGAIRRRAEWSQKFSSARNYHSFSLALRNLAG